MKAFDVRKTVPLRVFEVQRSAKDDIPPRVVAVEILDLAAEGICFSDGVAINVVARLPDDAVRKCRLGNQRGAKVVLVRGSAA